MGIGTDIMSETPRELRAEDYDFLLPYFKMRYSHTCENVVMSHFIWKDYYNTRYVADEGGLIWIMNAFGETFSMLPLCREEDLRLYFDKTKQYFNQVLGKKLVIYLADEKGCDLLRLSEDEFSIEADRRYFDYIYSADKLRTLSGKKYHKKKNHLNAFLKEYEGRYEYRSLCCGHKDEIMSFLRKWEDVRDIEDEYHRVDFELNGIEYLLEHQLCVDFNMGAVYIDGRMEAFSLGVYGKHERMAVIHVEKANPNIRGLYAFINQQMLVHEFPDALFVNREDDMGLEGLRKAKMSYHPIYLMQKYNIIEK